MRHRRLAAFALSCLAALLCAGPPVQAQASPPLAVTHQGRLSDNLGLPLSGSFSFQFALWDAPTGGTLLLSDAQTVGVSQGLYTAKIGTGTLSSGAEGSLAGVFGNHSSVWVQISVNGETLSPRTQLTSASYAVNAYSLGGIAASGFLDVTSTPQTKSGSLTVGGLGTSSFAMSNGAASGYVLTSDGAGTATWQPVSAGSAGGWTDGGTTVYTSSGGDGVNIGGGNVAPFLGGKLQVDGHLNFGPFSSDGDWSLRWKDDAHFINVNIGPPAARVNRMEFNEFGNKNAGSGAFRWRTGSPALPGGAITRMILYGDETAGGGHLDVVTGDLQLGGVSRITSSGSLVNVSYAGTPVGVGFGGTGATSFTANGVLTGNGTGAVAATAAPTAAGQVLKWTGTAWAPGTDATGGGGGTVTSVGTGAGLTGGPITASGTIDLLLNASGGLSKALGAGSNELGISTGGVTAGMILDGTIANADISSAAAIADTKLATISAAGKVADSALSANVSLLGSAIDLNTAETAGVLPVAKGGTGSSTQNFVDLSTAQTVGGAKTFSANGVFNGLLGVGASPAAKLTVYTTTSVDGISLDGTTNPAMIFKTNGVTRGFIGLATTSGAYSIGATANADLIYRTEAGKLLFSTNGGGNTTMTITQGAPGSLVIGGTAAGSVNNIPLFETQQAGGATDWWRVGRFLNTNMSTGKHTLLMVGRSDGQGAGGKGNAAQVGFYYAGDGSASNRAWFGLSWADYMYMNGNGDLVLNGASATGYKPGGGSWAATSDARLKKNVRPIPGALDLLLSLRGVRFEWNEDGLKRELCRSESEQTGFIAQEVEKVFPDWVTTMPDGYKAVGVKGFEALAVESLREMNDRITRENEALKARIAALEKAISVDRDTSAAAGR